MLKQLSLTLLCFWCVQVSIYAQHKLHITVTNLRSKGTVYIAIYNRANYFNDPNKAYQRLVMPVTKNTLTATAQDLPTGDYAIAVYQDMNGNKKIDKNILGIPTEPFGFSNNVRPLVSAPTFKQCKVIVEEPEKSISIALETYF